MKKTGMLLLMVILTAAAVIFISKRYTPLFASGSDDYHQNYIGPTADAPLVNGIAFRAARSDGVQRIYTVPWRENRGYEFSFDSGSWRAEAIVQTEAYCVSPVVADLEQKGMNTLLLGGWESTGVRMYRYTDGWALVGVLPGSAGKGSILCMKIGDGRNDGVTRLYVSHWSESGLVEYSWNKETNRYTSKPLFNQSAGRFAIGQGRNDGRNRIYAVQRGGLDLHEFSWNGQGFDDTIIFHGSHKSNGSVHIADGRGDRKNRIYAWAGGLFELTWDNGVWSSLVLDRKNMSRYYINAGSVRRSQKPSIYVSAKKRGLYQYTWSASESRYDVDVISGATGSCAIADGRGDGKKRLYVGRGNSGHFNKAAIVEMWVQE